MPTRFSGPRPSSRRVTTRSTSHFLTCFNQLLRCWRSSFPELNPDSESYDGLPYKIEKAILEAAARLVSTLDDDGEAEAIWRPLLELGPAASAWLDDFLYPFLSAGFAQPVPPPIFARRWLSMIEFTRTSPAWNAGGAHYRHANSSWDVHGMLVGLLDLLVDCWEPPHQEALRTSVAIRCRVAEARAGGFKRCRHALCADTTARGRRTARRDHRLVRPKHLSREETLGSTSTASRNALPGYWFFSTKHSLREPVPPVTSERGLKHCSVSW